MWLLIPQLQFSSYNQLSCLHSGSYSCQKLQNIDIHLGNYEQTLKYINTCQEYPNGLSMVRAVTIRIKPFQLCCDACGEIHDQASDGEADWDDCDQAGGGLMLAEIARL